ncbi:AI-2E family transporter [Flavobacterium sp. DG1-102-2]|uniref:AI-2E family transporter n=1 Tax=Flavobacterium sp. DG1-102-2 TaxID=3081663 RepID=UPI002949BF64|nr:AI-2E family transporter [Flavobacterium sp. DG1-102-2]MDV6167324.1 AI-2E family transporter [Flavobacterium sp. DG1-102-2]
MKQTLQFPFYAKFAFILLILILITIIYFYGQSVISPLLLSLLFAILLRPVSGFLNIKLRIPHTLACVITVLLFVVFFGIILYFISTQLAVMANDWDKIKSNLAQHYKNIQLYINDTLNISKTEQDEMVSKATSGSMDTGKQLLGTTLISFSDSMMSLITIPIYTFLILLYRTHFVSFLCQLVKDKYHATLQDILKTVKTSVQSYIIGLLFEFVIVSVLTSIGLMILGLKYAILLGVITGLLNLIPYIGIVIAGVLTVIASLTGTSDLSIILGILIVNVVVQLIDNNILVPMVVSSKVEINSIASIVGIIIFGMIAGISGMFLAIPIMAIAKVIFDRVDSLKPWGYLLGDDLPKNFSWKKGKRLRAVQKPD